MLIYLQVIIMVSSSTLHKFESSALETSAESLEKDFQTVELLRGLTWLIWHLS
jgi:hypothetical protein